VCVCVCVCAFMCANTPMLIRAHTRQCWSGHTRANADQGTNALMLIRAHTRQFWSRHTCANADQGTCANADQGTHAPMLVRAYMRQCRQCTQTPHALLPIKLPPHPAARLQLHEPDLSGCCCRAAEGHSICAPMLQFLGSSPLQSEGACVPERDYKVKRASHNTRSTCMTHIKKPVRHNKGTRHKKGWCCASLQGNIHVTTMEHALACFPRACLPQRA